MAAKKVVKKAETTKPARSAKSSAAKSPATKSAKSAKTPALALSRPRRPRSLAEKKQQAEIVLARLGKEYPDAHCALDFTNAFELLCATILSAQCTDKRVNMVTPDLFKRYPNAAALAAAKQEDVEEIIRTTGFFRSKAKSLIGMATAVADQHAGDIPPAMELLVKLPGVGRKTANVILGNAFGRNDGIVVDTHVTRLSNRLGLVNTEDAVKIEEALIPLFPRDSWTMISHLLIEHGRQVCIARSPKCEVCVLNDVCPSSLVPSAPRR